MGWCGIYIADDSFSGCKSEIDRQHTWEDENRAVKVLKSALKRSNYDDNLVWYGAIQNFDKKKKENTIAVSVTLIGRNNTDSTDGCNYFIKSIPEDAGPAEDNCPLEIMKLLPPPKSKDAVSWRLRVFTEHYPSQIKEIQNLQDIAKKLYTYEKNNNPSSINFYKSHTNNGKENGMDKKKEIIEAAQKDIDRQNFLKGKIKILDCAMEQIRSKEDPVIWHIKAQDIRTEKYVVWRCFNEDTGSLNWGHYDLNEKEADELLYKDAETAMKNGKEKEMEEKIGQDGTKVTVMEARKPYYQLNAEDMLMQVKNGNAPFISNPLKQSLDEKGNVLIRPVAIRSAETGRPFKGTNQLLAQIGVAKMNVPDNELITYQQAQKHETFIMKGAPHITLTTYDTETKKSSFYHYFPKSAVHDQEKLQKLTYQKPAANLTIKCNESDPEKYLGKYLAATAMGAGFETNPKTVKEFQQKMTADLEKNFAEKHHTRIFEIGSRASENCKQTIKELYKPVQQQQERSQEKNMQRPAQSMDGGYNG